MSARAAGAGGSGSQDRQGQFRIDGVTGPDEYSAIADNNVDTNLMAQQNLSAAADCATRQPAIARALGVEEAEMAEWRSAAEAMRIPFDEELGVHPQADGFTEHQEWGFAHTTITAASVSYVLLADPPITLTHHGEALTVSQGESRICPTPACVPTSQPSQPPGRERRHRRLSHLPSRARRVA